MNSQVLYNIQQADEIRKLKEERDQLLKIHDKVCNQAAELLKVTQKIENNLQLAEKDKLKDWAELGARVYLLAHEIRAAIQNATR